MIIYHVETVFIEASDVKVSWSELNFVMHFVLENATLTMPLKHTYIQS